MKNAKNAETAVNCVQSLPLKDLGLGVAGNAVWDMIKARLPKRSAATAEAVAEVEKKSATVDEWDALKIQLRKALKEDEGFCKELEALLTKHAGINQKANVTGDENIVVQSSGAGSVHIQR